jgi:hypothetical protein
MPQFHHCRAGPRAKGSGCGIICSFSKLAAQRARSFYGGPALGGTCHTHAAIERWYKRLPRVLSGLSFEIKTIAAPKGPIP